MTKARGRRGEPPADLAADVAAAKRAAQAAAREASMANEQLATIAEALRGPTRSTLVVTLVGCALFWLATVPLTAFVLLRAAHGLSETSLPSGAERYEAGGLYVMTSTTTEQAAAATEPVRIFQEWYPPDSGTLLNVRFDSTQSGAPFALVFTQGATLRDVSAEDDSGRALDVSVDEVECHDPPGADTASLCQTIMGTVPDATHPSISLYANSVEPISTHPDWAHQWIVIPSTYSYEVGTTLYQSLGIDELAKYSTPATDASFQVVVDEERWRIMETEATDGQFRSSGWAGDSAYGGSAVLVRRDASSKANLWLVGGAALASISIGLIPAMARLAYGIARSRSSTAAALSS